MFFGKIFEMSLFWSHLLRRSVWPISVLISHLLLINRSALVPRLLGGSHSKHINLGRSEKISNKGIKHRKTFQSSRCFDQMKQSNKTKAPNKTEEKTTFAAKHLFWSNETTQHKTEAPNKKKRKLHLLPSICFNGFPASAAQEIESDSRQLTRNVLSAKNPFSVLKLPSPRKLGCGWHNWLESPKTVRQEI